MPFTGPWSFDIVRVTVYEFKLFIVAENLGVWIFFAVNEVIFNVPC